MLKIGVFLISRKGEKAQMWPWTDQGSKAGGCWGRVEVTVETQLPWERVRVGLHRLTTKGRKENGVKRARVSGMEKLRQWFQEDRTYSTDFLFTSLINNNFRTSWWSSG